MEDMIDTIIFDFGGVLYKVPDLKKLLRWQKLLGIAADDDINQLIYEPSKSQLFWDVMEGKLSEDKMWEQIMHKWKVPERISERFLKNVMSKRRLNKPLAKYLKSFRSGYKTAILSNAGDQTRSKMEKSFGAHTLVDEIIISAEEGIAKPDKAIYHIAIKRLNSIPENCVFVDDLIENVNAALEIGMKAIHHINNDLTIATLNDLIRAER